MRPKRRGRDPEKMKQVIAEARKARAQREEGYREQALKLFPHVCARCGRSFEGPRLRELTVHHKDHNHHNNPPDGSNWELLCIYCHDAEHQDPVARDPGRQRGHPADADNEDRLGFSAFEGLKGLVQPEEDDEP